MPARVRCHRPRTRGGREGLQQHGDGRRCTKGQVVRERQRRLPRHAPQPAPPAMAVAPPTVPEVAPVGSPVGRCRGDGEGPADGAAAADLQRAGGHGGPAGIGVGPGEHEVPVPVLSRPWCRRGRRRWCGAAPGGGAVLDLDGGGWAAVEARQRDAVAGGGCSPWCELECDRLRVVVPPIVTVPRCRRRWPASSGPMRWSWIRWNHPNWWCRPTGSSAAAATHCPYRRTRSTIGPPRPPIHLCSWSYRSRIDCGPVSCRGHAARQRAEVVEQAEGTAGVVRTSRQVQGAAQRQIEVDSECPGVRGACKVMSRWRSS